MHLEETITDYFKANSSGTAAVYIFGSQASGKCIPSSDVDIAVLFDRCDPDFIRSRMDEILLRLPKLVRKDVHPVVMNSASVRIRNNTMPGPSGSEVPSEYSSPKVA